MGQEYYMIFKIGDEEYGVDINDTVSIITMTQITRVPKTPSYIKGVINLRGEIVPIMNMRERIGFPIVEETEDTRIIIFKVKEAPIGGIVDSVTEVIELPNEHIKNISELGTEKVANYICGIANLGERVITLIDLEKLIA